MKIIKAGTYTFSPIPYIPVHMPSITQENFIHTVNTTYGELTGNYISFAADKTEELTEYWPNIQYGDELCFDHFGWPDEDYGPDCRTITTSFDQEVGDEFYDIFVRCTNYSSVNNIPIDAFGWRKLKTDYKPFPVWGTIEPGLANYLVENLKIVFKSHNGQSNSWTVPIDAYLTGTSHAEGIFTKNTSEAPQSIGFFDSNTSPLYTSMIEAACTTSGNIMSIANDTIGHWIAENTIPVVRKLTRLYPGPIVAKSAARQLRKLTTEKPQTESVIGTWILNDEITFEPLVVDTYYNFDFYFIASSNKQVNRVGIIYSSATNDLKYLAYENNQVASSYVYNFETNTYSITSYKTIYITTEPTDQAVITWLKANATKTDQPQTERVEGIWVFNNTLTDDLPTGKYYVELTCNNIVFDYMNKTDYSSLAYLSNEKIEELDGSNGIQVYFYEEWESYSVGWTDELYRTIDFGTTPQTVTKEFYNWLTTNAVKQESIVGTWVLNSTFDNSGVSSASINVNNVQMYIYDYILDDLLTFQPNADGSLLLVPKTTNRSVMLYNTLDGVSDGKTARVEWSGGRYVYVDTDYSDQAKLYKTLIVNGDTGSKLFDNWLKAHATKIA